jgi:hypothetical protein
LQGTDFGTTGLLPPIGNPRPAYPQGLERNWRKSPETQLAHAALFQSFGDNVDMPVVQIRRFWIQFTKASLRKHHKISS